MSTNNIFLQINIISHFFPSVSDIRIIINLSSTSHELNMPIQYMDNVIAPGTFFNQKLYIDIVAGIH